MITRNPALNLFVGDYMVFALRVNAVRQASWLDTVAYNV